jgi:hypothetical protein
MNGKMIIYQLSRSSAHAANGLFNRVSQVALRRVSHIFPTRVSHCPFKIISQQNLQMEIINDATTIGFNS